MKIHINYQNKPIGTMDFGNHAIVFILCPIREREQFEELRNTLLATMLDHAAFELGRPCEKCHTERKLQVEPVGQVEQCPTCGDPAYNIGQIPWK